MRSTSRLRDRLRQPGMLIAPGAYDGLTAMLVAQAGFAAVYMTGAGTSVAHGYPDFGLLTETEMVTNAARMTRAVDIPLIADADTGYGNELNVFRTVRDHEAAGVAGIHIEDQVSPKRCGHLDDKEIVPREDWIAKLRAAAAARRDPDFLIIARTDSRAVAGFEEAVSRANEALANGADMAFVEAPQTSEEIAAVPKLVRGPCLLNVVWGGKSPAVDLQAAEAMGFKLAIVPGLLFKAVIGACDAALAALKGQHAHPEPAGRMTVRDAFNRVGAREWEALRTRFR
ncbi:isocitrate lyase/PEP mutase family protein [Rhodopila sp.]|jgi:2-methylisocitrate lyase-like PEP mutase family enzyme|uniref:isocitrate lyase/PEP mutase family protein n=1 Tax=Rhodopila sp. TaxID=2480087 RepID=UPI002CCB0487|nr:isocitrate lyase/PEP mutase family protein [Rhodopila sp.]HVZ06517.1 isocitrate lyase/PEP mutase family protein [Rhodopila sp.]